MFFPSFFKAYRFKATGTGLTGVSGIVRQRGSEGGVFLSGRRGHTATILEVPGIFTTPGP